MKPVLKYLGSKRRLLPQITPLLPSSFEHLVSPCLGSGALEFHVLANCEEYGLKGATVSDANMRLMRMYRGILSNPTAVARRLGKVPFSKEYYLKRALQADPEGMSDVDVAVWMLYVNRCARSGMYREAKVSKYRSRLNIPWGNYKNANYATAGQLKELAKLLGMCRLRANSLDMTLHRTWRALLASGKPSKTVSSSWATLLHGGKTLVFVDPPYQGTFQGYVSKELIGIDAQRDRLLDIVEAGGMVMYCNADREDVRDTFSDPRFTHHRVTRSGALNSVYDERSPVGELVITAGY